MKSHALLHAKRFGCALVIALAAMLFCASSAYAATENATENANTTNTTNTAATTNAANTSSTTLTTQDTSSASTKAKAATTTIKTAENATTSIAGASVTASGLIRHIGQGVTNVAPTVKVVLNGKTLELNKDYKLRYEKDGAATYSTPSSTGTYKVYAEGTGSYSGEKLVTSSYVLRTNYFASGNYYIFSKANSSCLLDAAGKTPKTGSNVSIWTRNGGTNQQWKLELQSDGYYIIRNVANTNLVLDAAGATPKRGANVSTWTKNSGLNQRWTVEKDGDYYIIQSASNSKFVLDASGKSPKTGANVTVYDSNGGNNQRWKIQTKDEIQSSLDAKAAANKSAIADGTYTIYASALSGNPVLDVKNSSTSAGANIQLASSNASSTQKWTISHDSLGYVQIKNSAGKYLSVASNKETSGANVQLGSNGSDRGTKWIFVKNGSSYTIQSALFSDIVLDITGGKSAAGTNVETYTSNGTNAQKFNFVATPANVASGSTSIKSGSYFYIKSSANTNLQLDVTGASKSNNANIELWTGNSMLWQLFKFEQVGNYYRIVNAYTGKALAVANSSLVPGANVVNTTSSSADNQLWAVKVEGSGSNATYTFTNKKSGYVLQVASSSQKAGTNINVGASSSAATQKFKLVEATDLLPTGLYNFKSALNTSEVLDVTGASTANNANIEVWSNNGGLNQKWCVAKVGANTYTLQATCSGKYLAVNSAGNVVQVSSGTDAASHWTVSIENGAYVLKNASNGKLLSVANAKTASNGTNVNTTAATGSAGANQRWNIASTDPIPNGTYILRSSSNSSQVIDVAGKSTSNSANVDMWKYNGGGNQKFTVTKNSDGTYTIVNCLSGKALDASGGKSSAGTNIIQYSKNGGKNQKWKVSYSNGGFVFTSAANSNVVLGSSAVSNGSNVSLVTANSSSKTQRYTLEKTTYTPPMPADKQAMYNKAQGYSSNTGYLFLVDRKTHKVGVFKGSKGNWSYVYYWSCVTGAASSPTITGTYKTTGLKKTVLSTDSRARWCTQINGGYFFHTILASESELGRSASHGCIRLAVSNAKWIYNNIGKGTTVVIYN